MLKEKSRRDFEGSQCFEMHSSLLTAVHYRGLVMTLGPGSHISLAAEQGPDPPSRPDRRRHLHARAWTDAVLLARRHPGHPRHPRPDPPWSSAPTAVYRRFCRGAVHATCVPRIRPGPMVQDPPTCWARTCMFRRAVSGIPVPSSSMSRWARERGPARLCRGGPPRKLRQTIRPNTATYREH
jgi:hypothetical protein